MSNSVGHNTGRVIDGVRDFFSAADAGAVFAPPQTHNGTMVINAAEIAVVGGFGLGFGEGKERDGGGGGGGGGSVHARPVAMIIIDKNGNAYANSLFDVTQVALTLFTTVALMWRVWHRRAK